MINKCLILFFSIIIFGGLAGISQEKYQFNAVFGPSYENISSRNASIDLPFQFKYSYNFGGEIKYYLSPHLSTNIGVQYNNKGFSSNFDYVVSNDTFPSSLRINASYLSIPIDLCWNFSPAFRTEYFLNVGINYGVLLGQSFKGQRVPVELGRPDNPLYEGISNEKSNISWFDKNAFGVQAGAGISRYVKSRMVLTFHPTAYFQMDRLINPEGPVQTIAVSNNTGLPELYSPKLYSFLLLFKVGYYFSDQIENTKKIL